ncbi:hypothetical protein [Sphingomonas sp. ID0503]|uniref:hypothetical protein n=1 Tax=Sphingomonas sp. ID0503 TaxID=3399691 RepID=UPI003AFA4EAC
MRLTQSEVDAIKAAVAEAFGADAVVRLFGSRVHDHLRGGDIDLHLELRNGRPDAWGEARFVDRLFRMIDERQIDLVYRAPDAPMRPIDRVAYAEGIVL